MTCCASARESGAAGNTNYLPSSRIKNSIYVITIRSQNALHFGLESCLGAYPSRDPADGWRCAKGKMVFQWSFHPDATRWYHGGRHEVSQAKNTYAVEGDNAECMSKTFFAHNFDTPHLKHLTNIWLYMVSYWYVFITKYSLVCLTYYQKRLLGRRRLIFVSQKMV